MAVAERKLVPLKPEVVEEIARFTENVKSMQGGANEHLGRRGCPSFILETTPCLGAGRRTRFVDRLRHGR